VGVAAELGAERVCGEEVEEELGPEALALGRRGHEVKVSLWCSLC